VSRGVSRGGSLIVVAHVTTDRKRYDALCETAGVVAHDAHGHALDTRGKRLRWHQALQTRAVVSLLTIWRHVRYRCDVVSESKKARRSS
jgi:hypothetical protein